MTPSTPSTRTDGGGRPTVVLLGAWDTKAEPLTRLYDGLVARGCAVHRVDVGTGSTAEAETTATELAARAGLEPGGSAGRAATLAAMGGAAAEAVAALQAEGRVDGLVTAAGSGGADVFAAVLPVLPFGVPKVLVSTIVAGDTRPYLQGLDAQLVFPVVDVEGDNHVLRSVLDRTAAGLAAQAAEHHRARSEPAPDPSLEVPHETVAVSMFGITTPCVGHLRRRLEARGDEVLAFHANGTGGASMERLVRDGLVDAVVDVTTTELADLVAGGTLSAGEDRLTAAAEAGVPQVVVPGALDTINFGPPESVPAAMADRTLHRHNRFVTLVRTDAEESARLGELVGERVSRAPATTTVVLPRGGVSSLDAPGGDFWDPEADEAFRAALRRTAGDVRVVEVEHHVNDEAFAEVLTAELDRLRGRG